MHKSPVSRDYSDVFAVCRNVVIKPHAPQTERTTAAGLIVPDSADDKQRTGTVIAIGSEADDQLYIGCDVTYSIEAAVVVKYKGESLHTVLDGNLWLCIGHPDAPEND